jgi:hypothetical protein
MCKIGKIVFGRIGTGSESVQAAVFSSEKFPNCISKTVKAGPFQR